MHLASRWLLCALLLSGCRSALPNRDPLGRALPSVTGEALDGREWRLPEDLAGRPAVLLVGYEQRAQFDADRWLFGLLQAETPARLLEVPTIPGLFGRALAGTIDSGMRSGIPHEDWGTVVTLYGDAAARMKAFTGTENGRNMRVLVLDEHGVVRWSHDRGFSAAKCLELDRLVRSIGQGELAAPTTSPSPTSAVPPSARRPRSIRPRSGPSGADRRATERSVAALAGIEVNEAWSVPQQGYMTSPVLIDGHAYLFLRSNRATSTGRSWPRGGASSRSPTPARCA